MKEHLFTDKGNLTKRELLRVSAHLFREKGYRATSMQDIANALGIQKASVYYYIDTKLDLLRGIARLALDMLLAEGERIASSSLPPDAKLGELIASHIRLICENLDLFTVSLRELTPINAGPFWHEMVILRDRYEALVRNILRSGIDAGCFRPVDEKLAGFALLGMINWLIRWVDPQGEKTPEEIAAVWQDLFFCGIRIS